MNCQCQKGLNHNGLACVVFSGAFVAAIWFWLSDKLFETFLLVLTRTPIKAEEVDLTMNPLGLLIETAVILLWTVPCAILGGLALYNLECYLKHRYRQPR